MQLSRHFALDKFLRSQVAERLGMSLEPPADVIERLRELCQTVLEPAREAIDKPIVVSSGWRPDWLNAAIKGAPNSAHISGRAADCYVLGLSPRAFAHRLRDLDAPIDKCILEFNSWVHVQIAANGAPRRQFLTARVVDGATVYSTGIHA